MATTYWGIINLIVNREAIYFTATLILEVILIGINKIIEAHFGRFEKKRNGRRFIFAEKSQKKTFESSKIVVLEISKYCNGRV